MPVGTLAGLISDRVCVLQAYNNTLLPFYVISQFFSRL